MRPATALPPRPGGGARGGGGFCGGSRSGWPLSWAELYLKAGKQTVKGEQALGYVRARYSLGNGSDLERIERQKFMASVVDKATSGSVLTDPKKTYKFLKAATKSTTISTWRRCGSWRTA